MTDYDGPDPIEQAALVSVRNAPQDSGNQLRRRPFIGRRQPNRDIALLRFDEEAALGLTPARSDNARRPGVNAEEGTTFGPSFHAGQPIARSARFA